MEMPARRSIVERMKGAAMLDVATYEEVEHDQTATGQAAVVVALVAVAAAIGGARSGSGGIISGVVGAFAGWLIWAAVTWFVGTRLFRGTAHWSELLRTIGFAQAPGVLLVLAIVPILGWLVRMAVFVWLLAAGVVAIRQALDITTGQAVITGLVAWLVVMVVMFLLGTILGLGMMM